MGFQLPEGVSRNRSPGETLLSVAVLYSQYPTKKGLSVSSYHGAPRRIFRIAKGIAYVGRMQNK